MIIEKTKNEKSDEEIKRLLTLVHQLNEKVASSYVLLTKEI
jgi:hypothetical protein